MTIRYDHIGQRLKAYRLAAALTAEQVADRLGVSRAAVYRFEKGELIKIDTLERLAELLGVSLPSLLGVGVEYYPKAVGYFERMRQMEADAEQVLAHFEPVSYLLTSDEYSGHLRLMLEEAVPDGLSPAARRDALAEVEGAMAILDERKAAARRRCPGIVSLIGLSEIERFLRIGLVGRFDLPREVLAERRQAARREVARIADLMEQEPIGVQLGLVEDVLPNLTFQIFRLPDVTLLGVSPFRLGEQPNIRIGIATVTAAPEAVALYEKLVTDLWSRSLKGARGASRLRGLVQRLGAEDPPGRARPAEDPP
ncbi:helix-turn-helix transcriptional regulator [Arenibaculum sp.]|jgi:transcriptional regulator with XRE-family HTH domain|uniref:helix-turn-helix domain-containing protein n=1 Tax=Arenibaculum sp. TaxID=2865862 RepID=UPI002E118876|nr:helix-turn-helix transcriptional regulator [Arenibaculum sp.]